MGHSQNENLYFIAIVLKGDLAERVTSLKHYVADTYASKAALRSPPHITLHMPFRKRLSEEFKIYDLLNSFSISRDSFELKLIGFNCFEPRVIFIDIEYSESLYALQKNIIKMASKELKIFNGNYKNRPYKPHITIAFRDLSKSNFQTAWKEFRNRELDYTFTCNDISLLKHNSKIWEVVYESNLRT